MKNNKIRKKWPLLVTVLLDFVLFVAVFSLMSHVQKLLYSDVQINLVEVVTQNKDVINSKLKVEVNNLDLISNQVEERIKQNKNLDNEALREAFLEVYQMRPDDRLYLATKDGRVSYYDGSEYDISGRSYFRLAMEGVQNISDRIVSRVDGNEIFVISVPLYCRGEVVGTVQKIYTPDEMYQLCALSLFSSQGYMYIINSEGYILISSRGEQYSQESNNYFRMIYANGNREASNKVQEDIKNEFSGFIETEEGGKKIFSAYTPIEQIHEWYLISSIDTNAVSPNSNIVVKMFYIILCVMTLIFALSTFYFLTYKNRQQANLEHIAFYDTVTHGNTYNKFIVDLNETLSNYPDKKFYLMTFDIDNFKYVNNYYGFAFGDKILRNISESIGNKLNSGETIARISGDHFIVLLEDAREERLNDLLSELNNEEGVMVYLSAGLYEITDPEESVNLMVDKASTAAQEAKGVYHKKVQVYSEKFDRQIIHNEQTKRAVERALENDEIVPFYQPKVNVNTGELVGAEVLARWKKADGSLVSPIEFIPICEKTGLIVELDMVIFEKTLRFIKKNLDDGIECVPISVNFSRLHLPDEEFLNKVVRMLNQYQVPPHLIEIELTESVIFDNFEIISEFTNRVHEYGLSISMDDFGSGYSSLNMLKDIPIDVLKIDRGFLKETANSERRYIILASIAQMAKKLDIKVVMEGVETLDNVSLMKELGYVIAQGYYFAKPMNEEFFNAIYREKKV